MEDLKALSIIDLEKIITPKFKAKDIFRFIHKYLKEDLSAFSSLSLTERQKLAEKYCVSSLAPEKALKAQGIEKVSFRLKDGKVIEAVSMEYAGERNTVCVSSQVGCAIGCGFCATGRMGFKRNLTVSEILSQVYYFARKEKVSNVVFMGMGEPFLNYNNALSAARFLNHPLGLNIAARKIVFSTIGITAGIFKLAEEKEQFRLAWSMVAPLDEIRKELIPSKFREPVSRIVQAIRAYQKKTDRRVTIEYVVLKDLNDRKNDVQALIAIAKDLDSHINLIPYNPIGEESKFKVGNIRLLLNELQNAGLNVTVRKSLGQSIKAACGQLAAKI